MPPPTRKIGNTDVAAIGWGAMSISGLYGSVQSDEERLKVLDRAYELGITSWDSADVYKDSEELIGKWFARTGKRADIFLATKFGFQADMSRFRGDAPYVREAVERSLKRFGVKQIDLYYPHRVDPKVPIEETVGAMAELVKEGKIKYVGLSEPSSNALRRAHAIHPIAAVQIEYSPFTLDIEDPKVGILATARELGISIVAYSPLGRGMLTGKFRTPGDFEPGDIRKPLPRVANDHYHKVVALADDLERIGERHHATASQICLAWLLAQGEDIIPIPGTKTIKHLEENVRSLDIKLSPEENDAVRRAAIESGAGEAPRYGEASMKGILLDSPLPGSK